LFYGVKYTGEVTNGDVQAYSGQTSNHTGLRAGQISGMAYLNQFEGNIFVLLEKSEKYISERINWRVLFGKLERREIPEVPVNPSSPK